MSKSDKLASILTQKGWDAKVYWEPILGGGIMCNSEGGYCVEIKNHDTQQLGYRGHWLGYDYDSALVEANKYPVCQ